MEYFSGVLDGDIGMVRIETIDGCLDFKIAYIIITSLTRIGIQ
jgi:hypothetical protein